MTLVGTPSKRTKRPWLRLILLSVGVAVVVALIGARLILGEIVRFQGQQMEPALKHGDWLFIDYRSPPERGDALLIEATPRPVVRRLVALPGEPLPERHSSTAKGDQKTTAQVVPERHLYLSCDRVQWCAAGEGIGLTDGRRVIGVVAGRWASPF